MKKYLLLFVLPFVCSSWAAEIDFSGQPENLTMCTDTATGCFDLTVNNAEVLVDLNPADYTITYHLSEAAATADTNPIANAISYCIAPGSQTIYLRKETNATGEFEIYDFTISVHTAFGNALVLSQMVQCDDDNDGFVIFNLVEGAYLIDDEVLSFYPSTADALAQTNEITNPTAYSLAAGVNSDTTIIVRQEIPGQCDTLTQLPIIALPNCNAGNMCDMANSLCSSLGVPFSNTINIEEAQPFYYACLAETPNPTWFYIPISSAGNLHLKIEQSTTIGFEENDIDADYIIFGPFTDPVTPCGNGTLMGNNIDSCSNSIANIEYPTVENVQPGEFYLMMIINYFNNPGYIKITEMPTSTAGIDCSGIALNAFLDTNANGMMDTGEQNFPLGEFNYELNDDGNVRHIISPSGTYNIYDANTANSYDIGYTIDSNYAANYALTTSSYSDIAITAGSGMVNYYFPVTATQAYADVAVAIVPLTAPMPGFEYPNKIIYSNLGSQSVSGSITFTKDPLLTILSVSESSAVNTPTGFTFSYSDLLPFEVREILVTMQVPTIPTVTLGNSLQTYASITPVADDAVPANNSFESSEKIIGSYDPNDKMESHGGQIVFSEFTNDDYLYYTIRFENTGTAPAINISVVDILDSSLDPGSLRMVSASHDYTLVRNDNEITWNFENVLLPFSSQDPIGSHGYITFMIKPYAGFELGDIIPNTASIYFDYNPAIITNTFTTEFVSALALVELENDRFTLWPNPSDDFVTISALENRTITTVAIYDLVGKQVLSTTIESNDHVSVDVSAIAAGVYLIDIQSSDGVRAVRKMVVK